MSDTKIKLKIKAKSADSLKDILAKLAQTRESNDAQGTDKEFS